MSSPARPEPAEHDPYWSRYISLVGDGNIVAILEQYGREMSALIRSLTEQQADSSYAPGKWSAKEVIGHVIDTERIFSYRALRISRNDPAPMEGFDQDLYVPNSPFAGYTIAELDEEFTAVRRSLVLQLRRLAPEAWQRQGIANGKEVTVRALAYIAAGHELHHRRILEERYL